MENDIMKSLLDAGAHIGHGRSVRNPAMSQYIMGERSGVSLIDPEKTADCLAAAASALARVAAAGKKILFVATKRQARGVVAASALALGMPYVAGRWPGGMLTNFSTSRKSVKKMESLARMSADGSFERLSKRERLRLARRSAKMAACLGSVADMHRLPAALFVVDAGRERIALAEARKLGIPTFGLVDTDSDPRLVDFPIPANDDSTPCVELIMRVISSAINEPESRETFGQMAEVQA